MSGIQMAKKKVCQIGSLKTRESTAALKDQLPKYVGFCKTVEYLLLLLLLRKFI